VNKILEQEEDSGREDHNCVTCLPPAARPFNDSLTSFLFLIPCL
jgi:hypothetical protein